MEQSPVMLACVYMTRRKEECLQQAGEKGAPKSSKARTTGKERGSGWQGEQNRAGAREQEAEDLT
jgi:hypothetical protein